MQAAVRSALVAGTVTASAVLASFSAAQPTGSPWTDAMYLATAGALGAGSGIYVRRAGLLVAAGAAALGTAGAGWLSATAVTLVAANVWLAGRPRPRRVIRVVDAALITQLLLRLEWPETGGATALLAAAGFVALAVSALRQARRVRRPVLAVGAAVAVTFVAFTVLFAVAVAGHRDALRDGVDSAEAGLAAARDGDAGAALSSLAKAEGQFQAAETAFQSWMAQPARLVPIVARYRRAGQDLSSAASGLAQAAATAVDAADAPALRLTGGRIDPAAVAAVERPAEASVAAAARALAAIDAAKETPLPEDVASRLDGMEQRIERARRDAAVAVAAARLGPGLLGQGGERRWFLAIQSPAEQRASGGIVGNYGELAVNDGRLRLERTGRQLDLVIDDAPPVGPDEYVRRYGAVAPPRFFLNATLTPHFPTAAAVMEEVYARRVHPVSGTISVDPIALAALLQLTGPVEVAAWPEPITSANAARVLLHDQYVQLDGPVREQFLEDVTRAVFDRIIGGGLPAPAEVAKVLAPVVRDGHLFLHSQDPDEQRLFERIRIAGRVRPVIDDYLMVVTQNGGESKIDWFQQRTTSYRARYDPEGGRLSATVELNIRNDAPPTGLPDYVVGGRRADEVGRGVSELWVSVYTPHLIDSVEVNGETVSFTTQTELNRYVHSGFVLIPPGDTRKVVLRLSGFLPPGARYRLDVDRQPTIRPETTNISIAGARGWSANGTTSARLTKGRLFTTRVRFSPAQ